MRFPWQVCESPPSRFGPLDGRLVRGLQVRPFFDQMLSYAASHPDDSPGPDQIRVMTDEMGSKQAKSKVATDTKILYLRTDPPVLDSLPEVGERPVRVVDHLVPVAGVQPLEGVPHHHELEEAPLGVLQFSRTLQ